MAAAAAAAALPGFEDMEIFLGKLHQFKNGGAGGCHDGACTVKKLGGGTAGGGGSVAPPPPPPPPPGPDIFSDLAALAGGGLGGGGAGYCIYGASWCVFCRRAKALLAALGLPFADVDVDEHGGAAAVRAAAGFEAVAALTPGIPLIFSVPAAAAAAGGGGGATAVGGYTELVEALRRAEAGGGPGRVTEAVLARAAAASENAVVRCDNAAGTRRPSPCREYGLCCSMAELNWGVICR